MEHARTDVQVLEPCDEYRITRRFKALSTMAREEGTPDVTSLHDGEDRIPQKLD